LFKYFISFGHSGTLRSQKNCNIAIAMKRIAQAFLIFLFSLVLFLPAQSADEMRKIDSLNQLIKNQTGQERLKSLIVLTEAYRLVSYDESLKTGNEAVNYADVQGLTEMKALVLRTLGQSAQWAGDFDLAFDYYQKSLDNYSRLNNRSGMAHIYNMMGDLKNNTSEYDTALVYFEKVNSLANELGNDTLIGASFQNRGIAWFETGRLNEAHDAFYRASILFAKLKDSIPYAQSVMNMSQVLWQWDQNDEAVEKLLTSIGIAERHQQLEILSKAYTNLGLIYYYDEGNYSLALDYYSKALNIREQKGYPIPIANILVNIANVYVAQKNFQEAFQNYGRALKIYDSSNAVQGIVRTHFHLGEAHHDNKEYKLSNQHLEKCLSKAQQFGIISYNSIATDLIMQNYIALNDFAAFQTYFQQYKAEKDSLEDAYNQLQAKEAKFRLLSEELQQLSDSRREENEKINHKLRTYNYLTAAIIGLILFSLLMLLIRRSVRKAYKKPSQDVV